MGALKGNLFFYTKIPLPHTSSSSSFFPCRVSIKFCLGKSYFVSVSQLAEKAGGSTVLCVSMGQQQLTQGKSVHEESTCG